MWVEESLGSSRETASDSPSFKGSVLAMVFAAVRWIPERNSLKDEGFSQAHGLRGLSSHLVNNIAVDLT